MSVAADAPLRAPTVEELEALIACAAEGSMVAAAESLRVSRPAVARRIRNLEALADRELLARGGRGVTLTAAGASLVASARTALAEQELLLEAIAAIRRRQPEAIDGLRTLFGTASTQDRAAQRPEVRIAETASLLEMVLASSATGLLITDAESGAVRLVNPAFCEFAGRSREELAHGSLDGHFEDGPSWLDLLGQLLREGTTEPRLIPCRREDGTLRVGRVSAQFAFLGGVRHALWTIDDVTPRQSLAVR